MPIPTESKSWCWRMKCDSNGGQTGTFYFSLHLTAGVRSQGGATGGMKGEMCPRQVMRGAASHGMNGCWGGYRFSHKNTQCIITWRACTQRNPQERQTPKDKAQRVMWDNITAPSERPSCTRRDNLHTCTWCVSSQPFSSLMPSLAWW